MNRFFACSKYFAVPLLVCAANSARAAEPAAPAIVPQPPMQEVQTSLQNGPTFVIPSKDPLEPFVVMTIASMETRALLEMVGAQAKIKFIVGDGVRGRVHLSLRTMKLSDFLNTLGGAANFAWDRIGTDTIIVVPKPAAPFFMVPAAPQPVPRVTPPNRFSIPNPALNQPKSPTNPNWRPFEFNGSTIYLVPLQTSQPPALATTTLKAVSRRF